MKRFSLMALLSLLLVMAFPFVASAQEGVEVGGTGTITAEGDGRAVLYGGGTVTATGDGLLEVYDRNGDATVSVTGQGVRTIRTLPNGDVYYRYRGFNGTATIEGSDVRVHLRGANLTLSATGTGSVHLYGEGSYILNGTEGAWAPRGVHLRLNAQ